ncbi:MAG: hypothetical protein AMJ75_00255 [Phycisphaerae bacterium SM1_79]|nr:MAG: hypothetical protein AMJ75_00255 [Phycisphaerae bacterium SM1_79]
MEVPDHIAPLQAENVEELRVELERTLNLMQRQIYLLRQFIEPGVVRVKNTPDKLFETLE